MSFKDLIIEDLNYVLAITETNWNLKDLIEVIKSDCYYAKAYYQNNKLCGFIIFRCYLDFIDLHLIEIFPNFRRLGLASKLINYLINIAKSKNISSIFLEVNINNKNAIELYKKFDFKINRIRENYYLIRTKNRFEDAYELKLQLT